MAAHAASLLPLLQHLPASLPREGALQLELQDGVPLLRASATVQQRIAVLLRKHQEASLTPDETLELDQYEELDDYLSFLNRLARNRERAVAIRAADIAVGRHPPSGDLQSPMPPSA